MPEATISRSFELKEFKTGAVRMASEAGVPTLPLIVWGAQRIWTKDHPRNVGRRKIPVIVAAGTPLPTGDVEHFDAAPGNDFAAALCCSAVSARQTCFLAAPTAGGLVPTVAEAGNIEDTENAERAHIDAGHSP